MQTIVLIVLYLCYIVLILLFSTAYNTSLIYCFVIWCLHTNKRRPCSSTLSGHPSSSCWQLSQIEARNRENRYPILGQPQEPHYPQKHWVSQGCFHTWIHKLPNCLLLSSTAPTRELLLLSYVVEQIVVIYGYYLKLMYDPLTWLESPYDAWGAKSKWVVGIPIVDHRWS